MLEELLKQFHNIINKYNFEFDKLPKAIWGVGNVANLNYTAGVFTAIKPEIFIDNGKANKTFIGKDIISFNDFLKLKKNKDYLVLTSILTQNILSNIFSQLKESNTKAFTVDHYIFTHQKKEVLETLDLLNDDLSKITYISMLIRRMGYSPTISFEYYTKPTRDSYFLLPQFHSRNSSQVFVDLGGYVGDTIESFLEHNDGIFKKIYSFEPNARNFKAMGYRVNRLINEWASEKDKFILENLGIGEFSQTAYIDAAINDGSALGAIISNNKQQDKEEIKKRAKVYREKHREELNRKLKLYRQTEEFKEKERQRRKEYYDTHKEKIREINLRYKQTHPEKMREYKQRYYQAHREEILTYKRNYIKRHPEKERQRKYYRQHAEKLIAYQMEYRRTHKQQIAEQKRKYRLKKKQ